MKLDGDYFFLLTAETLTRIHRGAVVASCQNKPVAFFLRAGCNIATAASL